MKDYFTTKDRVRHIFIIGLKPIIEDLTHSDALTPEESRNLTLAAKLYRQGERLDFRAFGSRISQKDFGNEPRQ